MPTTVTVTTVVTVPPTFFDLHYWIFGLVVILAITALMDGVLVEKTNVQIGSNAFIFTTLFGLLTGSFVALIMNVVPWTVPIGFLVIFVLYLWRNSN